LHRDLPLLALVRAQSPADARHRLTANLRRHGQRTLPSNWEVVLGDLDQLGGLDLDATTHVLHLAACTSFRSVRRVRHVNLEGTKALALALRRARRLQRFVMVSTAYISGDRAPAMIHEDSYPAGVEHIAEYTRTKADCEEHLSRLQLPVIVARPTAVVGHTTLGCGPSSSLFWYYRTVERLRRLPISPLARRDVVPVDYVAECLMALLLAPQLAHRCYHISAGESSAVTFNEIADAFAKCPGYEVAREPFQVVTYPELVAERERIQEILGPGDCERLLTALGFLWRFTGSGAEVFDNQRLLGLGLPTSPRFTDYLSVCARLPANRTIYQQLTDDA
jgi:nucleoside-diphosphate-sugar epimerase